MRQQSQCTLGRPSGKARSIKRSYRRCVAFPMPEVALPRHLFADILRLFAELRQPSVVSSP